MGNKKQDGDGEDDGNYYGYNTHGEFYSAFLMTTSVNKLIARFF